MGGDNDWGFSQTPESLKICGAIDYDTFQVVSGFAGDYILIVEKKNPNPLINPSLVPREYIDQPDYWEIDLVGCLIGINPPPTRNCWPLSASLAQHMGKKGIKLVGATKTGQWDLP